jgi:hypothetical protein
MTKPITNPIKTLQLEKSLQEVADAILFIPALSSTYKLANANPGRQLFTIIAAGHSNAYIDIAYRFVGELTTSVRVEVRRKRGMFERDADVSLANQHLNTVLNLLSDSLRLEPSKRSRFVSERTNERTATAHSKSQAKIKWLSKAGPEEQQNVSGKWVMYSVLFLLFAVVLYGLYRYFKP